MVLYVTRHGETDFNVQKRYTGSTDIPLNMKGVEQAEELANKLSSVNIKFDVIISSPLLRAKQTAEIIHKSIHKSCDVPLMIIEEFAEINVGVYEGLTREEAQMQYPETWARLADIFKKSGSRPLDDAPAGGETFRQFDARVAAGLTRLKTEYAENKNGVLLVCHGGTARMINRQLRELSFKEMDAFVMGNCEIEEYTV
jgi:probable phosphoglycerate mutase